MPARPSLRTRSRFRFKYDTMYLLLFAGAFFVSAIHLYGIRGAKGHVHSQSPASTSRNTKLTIRRRNPRRKSEVKTTSAPVLPGSVIHSTDPFSPHLHEVTSYAVEECHCPGTAAEDDKMNAVAALQQLHQRDLPLPTRLLSQPGADSEQTLPIMSAFSEVYIINLPNRTDRKHYMCSILQRLRMRALVWPAYSKRHPAVRSYSIDKRNAYSDPIRDVTPPPPFPEPPFPPTKEAGNEDDRSVEDGGDAGDKFTEDEQDGDPDRIKRAKARRKHFSMSQVACFLSHREVWYNIAHRELQKPVLILEDDVDLEFQFPEIMNNALKALPSDWAILFVGHCFEEKVSHEGYKVGHRLYRALRPACTHAYALRNASVAQTLLQELGHDLQKPIDLGFIALLEAKSASIPGYVMLPTPVAQLWRTEKRSVAATNFQYFVLQQQFRDVCLQPVGEIAAISNPSDVISGGMKLPLQKLVLPVKDILLAEAAAARDNSTPQESESIIRDLKRNGGQFDGDTTGLLCNNELFTLKAPDDAPQELVTYPDSDYLP